MNVTTVSKFRKDIKKYVDKVHATNEPLIVVRNDGMAVVVMSLESYNSMTGTKIAP